MQYIIRTPEGAEYGPADEATLIKWAGAGRIKADFEIRNEVMRKWHTAAETPFLKNVLRDRELEEKTTMGKKLGSFVNPTAELGSGQASNSLTNSGVFKWTNANAGRRLASFLFDAFVVAAIFWGLTFSLDLFPFKQAYLCYTLAGILISLAYFSLALGFMAPDAWATLLGRHGDPQGRRASSAGTGLSVYCSFLANTATHTYPDLQHAVAPRTRGAYDRRGGLPHAGHGLSRVLSLHRIKRSR